MTRGRKKDLTIPATRALVQQRDYRARRAKYVTELEERCRKAEEENIQLRKDLDAALAGRVSSISYDPQINQASAELIHNLSLASASLNRFQQLAFPEASEAVRGTRPTYATDRLPHLDSVLHELRPASFPSPAPSPPYTHSLSTAPVSCNHSVLSKKRLYREDSPHSPVQSQHDFDNSHASPSPSLDSECCGGIMDCGDFVEPEGDDMSSGDGPLPLSLSRLRSTSETAPSAPYRLPP